MSNEAKGNIVFLFGFLVYVGSLGLGYITNISSLKIDIAMAVGIFIEFIGLLIAYRSDKKVERKNSDKTVTKTVKKEDVALDKKEKAKVDTKPVKKRTALVLDSVSDEAKVAASKVDKPKTSAKAKTSGRATKKNSTSKANSTKKTINIKVNKTTKTSGIKKENEDSKNVANKEKKTVAKTKKTVAKAKETKTNNVKLTIDGKEKEKPTKTTTKATVKNGKAGNVTKNTSTKKRAAKK